MTLDTDSDSDWERWMEVDSMKEYVFGQLDDQNQQL